MDPNLPIESFDYFIGKVCSIHTTPTNWKLNADQTPDYFVGLVTLVNECGICITNVLNYKRTFIMMPSVVAIAEETVVDPNDPEDRKMLEEYDRRREETFKHNPGLKGEKPARKAVPPQPPMPKPEVLKGDCQTASPFIDLATIQRQAQMAKNASSK